ncbi:hypothetical protein ABIC89_000386 [Variovorax boronicumulans]|uniref:hypothetical protein n=1 Tax=Variovorax boronicumulans TaxID=436515 RepID=UPI0033933347
MSTPKPQTITNEISDMVRSLALNVGTHQRAQERAQPILDECDKLQRLDVVSASLLKANVHVLTGNFEQFEYWLKNAAANGASPADIAKYRLTGYFLSGEISKSHALFEDTFRADAGNAIPFLHQAIASGWFHTARNALNSITPNGAPEALLNAVREGADMMDRLNLSEKTTSLILDEAHGLLVSRGLIWLGSCPEISILEADQGGPAIYMGFSVMTPPKEAAELGWELSMRLATQDLDTQGLLISYQGTVLEAEIDPAHSGVPA